MSHDVENLWYKWQPLAIASIDKVYPEFDLDLIIASRKLHEALVADRDCLMEKYRAEIGEQ